MKLYLSLVPSRALDTGASTVNPGGQALAPASDLFMCRRRNCFCGWLNKVFVKEGQGVKSVTITS